MKANSKLRPSRYTRAVAALCGSALLGCHRPSHKVSRISPVEVPVEDVSGGHTDGRHPCTDAEVENVFSGVDDTTSKALIVDFSGPDSSDRSFAAETAEQIRRVLELFRDSSASKLPRGTPAPLELRRARCIIESQKHADDMARASRATLVIWGTVHSNPPSGGGSVEVTIETRDINVSGGRVELGTAELSSRAYTVSAHATLLSTDGQLWRVGSPLDVASIGHLTLPTLTKTPAVQLVAFSLGLHYLQKEQPWLAASMFLLSEEALPTDDTAHPALHGMVGYSFLYMPGLEVSARAHLAIAAESAKFPAQRADYLSNIGSALYREGEARHALEYYEAALALDEEIRASDKRLLTDRLSNVGQAHYALRDYSRAVEYFRRALKLAVNEYGQASDEELFYTELLASALAKVGKLKESLRLRERCFEIAEQRYGSEGLEIVAPLQSLALALHASGDKTRAYQELQRAVRVAKDNKDRTSRAFSMSLLADLYLGDGHSEASLALHEEALEVQIQEHGRMAPTVALLRARLARAQLQNGDTKGAVESYEAAIRAHRNEARPSLRAMGAALTGLGTALYEQGDYSGATDRHREALDILREVLGEEHPDLSPCLFGLAEALAAVGDNTAAIDAYEQALALELEEPGQELNAAATMTGLGAVYLATGNVSKAEMLYKRALLAQEKHAGRKSFSVAVSLMNIGLALHAKGDYAAALQKQRSALRTLRSLDEKHHREEALVLSNIGLTLATMSKSNRRQAMRSYDEAIDIIRRAGTGRHPDTATILNNRGDLFERRGDLHNALEDYTAALKLDLEIGSGAAAVARDRMNIAEVYFQQGKCALASDGITLAFDTFSASGSHAPQLARDLASAQEEILKHCAGT